MTQNADPLVPTYAEPDAYGLNWVLYVQCPHCGDLHTHGGGSVEGAPDMGHRVSHCVYAPAQGYYLVPGPTDMPKPQGLSRKERQRRILEADWSRGDFRLMPEKERARRERALRQGLIKSLREPVPSGAGS